MAEALLPWKPLQQITECVLKLLTQLTSGLTWEGSEWNKYTALNTNIDVSFASQFGLIQAAAN